MLVEGYHGTDSGAAKNIIATKFNESNGPEHWLGKGVYFFVNGISDPQEDAINWAKAQAWDNAKKQNRYADYSVLRCEVELNDDEILDLTLPESVTRFNDIKTQLLELIFSKRKNFRYVSPAAQSCMLFSFMVDFMEVDAVRHYLYIKPIPERRLQLILNVPNTTVLCVSEAKCITTKPEIVREGKVNE